MDNIILDNIKVEGNLITYKFTASGKLNKMFTSDELWIEYDEELRNVPYSILTIPFVSIMLPIMWVTDSVLWVKELDKTFYRSTFNLQQAFQNLFRNQSLRGRIVPSYLKDNQMEKSHNAFILFSGGGCTYYIYKT